MEAVMLSVRPQWCELIASGKKTLEVRKTRPKLPTPFKCYIYCTQGEERWLVGIIGRHPSEKLNGKVIGEFVCDSYIGWGVNPLDGLYMIFPNELVAACLSGKDFEQYGNGKTLYGWHISDLVIYDKPRELGEFHKPIMPMGLRYEDDAIKRPFQSWGYVEEYDGKH